MDIQDLYPIIDDLLYSRHIHIDIALPYYNKKKEVGPMLIQLFKEMSIHYISTKPQEWKVFVGTDRSTFKTINFVSYATAEQSKGRANLVIIPDDREEIK